MTQMIDAGQNPDLANSLIASAVDDSKPVATAEAEVAIAPPPDTQVTLMAGIVNQLEGTTVTDAVVRELTGADEEALAAPSVARSVVKFLQATTGRGTVSIGDRKPAPADFDGLLVGDRELLLLGIRRVTYGDEIELTTRCPHCDDIDEGYVFNLNDVVIRPLREIEDAIYGFSVTLPSGREAMVTLPRAVDQDALLQAEKKNEAELNTMMLGRCVTKIGEHPVLGEGPLRALSVRDRKALLEAIQERTPGPRLGEAKRVCNACEKEFVLGLGLLDIFRA